MHTHTPTRARGGGFSAYIHVKPAAICLEDGFPVIGYTYVFYVAVLDIICFYPFKKSSKCLMTSSWYLKYSKYNDKNFTIYHKDVTVPFVNYHHLVGTTLFQSRFRAIYLATLRTFQFCQVLSDPS